MTIDSDDTGIPEFLKLTQEERAEAWRKAPPRAPTKWTQGNDNRINHGAIGGPVAEDDGQATE